MSASSYSAFANLSVCNCDIVNMWNYCELKSGTEVGSWFLARFENKRFSKYVRWCFGTLLTLHTVHSWCICLSIPLWSIPMQTYCIGVLLCHSPLVTQVASALMCDADAPNTRLFVWDKKIDNLTKISPKYAFQNLTKVRIYLHYSAIFTCVSVNCIILAQRLRKRRAAPATSPTQTALDRRPSGW